MPVDPLTGLTFEKLDDPAGQTTVFHGTSADAEPSIRVDGLRPSNKRDHVFVTRTFERARDYARKRAAEKSSIEFVAEGLIVTLEIDATRLLVDTYNIHSEPDQWKIKGAVELEAIAAYSAPIEFPELANPVVLSTEQGGAAALSHDSPDEGLIMEPIIDSD